MDIRALVRLYRQHTSGLGRVWAIAGRPDFSAALAAMLGVLVFDTLPGLFIGIGVSLLLLVYRASRPNVAVLGRVPGTTDQYADVARHADNTPVPGLVLLRPESGLFFANADAVRDRIRRHAETPGTRAIVLDAESVPYIDVTAATMLLELARDLERRGIQLVLARDLGQVRELLRRATDEDLLPAYPTVQDAVQALTDPESLASRPKAAAQAEIPSPFRPKR